MSQRRPMVIGNWKMNTSRASAVRLAEDIAAAVNASSPAEVGVCPPFVYLDAVGAALRDRASAVVLGAQDVYHEPDGAFTGEISVSMLRDVGASLVLAGHSERRHVIGESDELVGRKVRAALGAGLRCILCVGETIEQRLAGQTDAVNERQLRAGLVGVTPEQLPRLTVAYEPVWAIGTGKTATPRDAADAHGKLRAVTASLFGPAAAASVRILYGGSVKPSNAAELFSQPEVDGGLIGGASLEADGFLAIVRAAAVKSAAPAPND